MSFESERDYYVRRIKRVDEIDGPNRAAACLSLANELREAATRCDDLAERSAGEGHATHATWLRNHQQEVESMGKVD